MSGNFLDEQALHAGPSKPCVQNAHLLQARAPVPEQDGYALLTASATCALVPGWIGLARE